MSNLPAFFGAPAEPIYNVPEDLEDSESSEEPVPAHAPEPVPAHAPAHAPAHVPAPRDILVNVSGCWRFINGLYWRDITEDPNFSESGARNKFQRLSVNDRTLFTSFLNQRVNQLIESRGDDQIMNELTNHQKKSLFSHVVGKGETFYIMSCDDFGFASYLIPSEFRNMYEILGI